MLYSIYFSFSKVKSTVRKNLADGFNGNFTELILNSDNQLTRDDLKNYYRQVYRNCT